MSASSLPSTEDPLWACGWMGACRAVRLLSRARPPVQGEAELLGVKVMLSHWPPKQNRTPKSRCRDSGEPSLNASRPATEPSYMDLQGTIPSQACLCCSFTQQEPEIQNSGLAGTKSPNLTACTGSRARLADFEPRSSKSLTVNSPFSEAYDLDTKTASPESCSGDCMSLLTVSHSGHFLCSR